MDPRIFGLCNVLLHRARGRSYDDVKKRVFGAWSELLFWASKIGREIAVLYDAVTAGKNEWENYQGVGLWALFHGVLSFCYYP